MSACRDRSPFHYDLTGFSPDAAAELVRTLREIGPEWVKAWVTGSASRRDNPWTGHPAGVIVWTVGRWRKITQKAGVGLPAGEGRTAKDAIDGLLELSRSQESRVRQLACRNLCTCHVQADDDRVWARLLELAEDPDPRVRGDVIHAITDSTPAPRVPAVIQALESRHNDPDVGIRRRVRKTLAHYRRTGKVTDAAH